MSADLRIENILIQVRSKLQDNEIKLWLPPYYIEDIGTSDADIEILARDFCQILNIPYDYCLAAITELQNNAIDKIRARNEFSKTGIATIKVRAPNQVGGTRLVTVHCNLSDIGEKLQENVAKELSLTKSRIKLISSGKVLELNKCLQEQGLKNNQQVMAVILENSPTKAMADESIYDRVQKTREDAKFLMNDQQQMMHMEDQEGNAIHLPPEERQSLLMALAMHEKGRGSLKKEKYSEALVLFLEADNEYSSCNSKLLETVDNYALLNLDIAWCYLCLRSVTQLPDAEKRLSICEQNFKKSYGENMDRVIALKGSSGNEKALIMRLHLLQGVLFFHQNRRNEAQAMLMLAESELNSLKVDDKSILLLAEMGYSVAEARVGLRACGGDIEQAITSIIQKREHRREARKQGKSERDLTSDTENANDETWVNPRNLHVLVEMGFSRDLCKLALQKSNNDVTTAINLLQDNSHQLQQELSSDLTPDSDVVEKMINMGFNADVVKMALQNATNNMDAAVEMLLKMQVDGTYDTFVNSALDLVMDDSAVAGTSQGTNLKNAVQKNYAKIKINKEIEKKKAFDRFSEDVASEEDEYLDLPLLQEENILAEYKRFLSM